MSTRSNRSVSVAAAWQLHAVLLLTAWQQNKMCSTKTERPRALTTCCRTHSAFAQPGAEASNSEGPRRFVEPSQVVCLANTGNQSVKRRLKTGPHVHCLISHMSAFAERKILPVEMGPRAGKATLLAALKHTIAVQCLPTRAHSHWQQRTPADRSPGSYSGRSAGWIWQLGSWHVPVCRPTQCPLPCCSHRRRDRTSCDSPRSK